jgi:membrane protease YdiL (CAAX protease family)
MTRSTFALTLLLFRHWARASLPNRLRKNVGRRASAGLLRFVSILMTSGWGYGVGHLVTKELGENRLRGQAWIVTGMLGLAVTWSALTRGPTLRSEPGPLETSFLDALPIRESSRLVVGLLERIFVYTLCGAALVAVFPGHPARAVVASLLLSTTGVFVGEASMRIARVLVPAMTIARARTYLLVFGQSVFFMCVVQAPALARAQRLGVLVKGWPTTVARAIEEGGAGYLFTIGATLAVAFLATGMIVLAERLGYDKDHLVPTGRPRRTKADRLVIERIDDVLRKREPGGRWETPVMSLYTSAITAGIVAFSWTTKKSAPAGDAHSVLTGAYTFVAVVSFVVVSQRAARMARRDVASRPLLAPLPIEPRALLAGKIARLRRAALIIIAPTLAMLATPWSIAMHVEIAWRVSALIVATVLATNAATAIAFLTVGAGNKKGPSGSFVVESLLVLFPLLGVATAPNALVVVVPLAALALVAREAMRSGLGCVRWIDDADDFERETPIWRALLVLSAFQSAQMVMTRAVGLTDLDEGTKLALAYVASSAVLIALTVHARREAPRVRVLPDRPGWIAAGIAFGVVSGALALGYLRALRHFDVTLPEEGAAGTSRIAIGIMAVAIAPIAEEIFFRGWLLTCIEDEMRGGESRKKWLTPLIGAFAFAAVHPPLAFVPVFFLGIFASVLFLRTRALLPSVIAHLVHNAIAIVLAAAL